MDRYVRVGAIYRHFKGNLYLVESIAMHTESNDLLVIYSSIKDGTRYARPIDMFISEVDHEKYPDATQKYRFELALQEG